jgi:hypothetical protein
MKRQTQWVVLIALLGVLFVTVYFMFFRGGSSASSVQTATFNGRFTPLNVDNPALRLDILKRFLALQYKGVHRNIFSAAAPPPPPTLSQKKPVNVAPAVPSGPPPLTVDAKYFGYVSDFSGNHRKGFFSTVNDEDVIIAGEGDTLMGHFRVVRITSTSADVEEVSSGSRTTLPLVEPGPNG